MRLLLLALLLTGCASAPPTFEERHLGTIPEDVRILVPVAFSADGRRAAWVERRSDSCRMVSGDRVGKPYGLLC